MPDGTRSSSSTTSSAPTASSRLLLELRREFAQLDLFFELPDMLSAIGTTVATDFPRSKAGDLASLLPLHHRRPTSSAWSSACPRFVDPPLEPNVNYMLIPRRDDVRAEMRRLFGRENLEGWYLATQDVGPPRELAMRRQPERRRPRTGPTAPTAPISPFAAKDRCASSRWCTCRRSGAKTGGPPARRRTMTQPVSARGKASTTSGTQGGAPTGCAWVTPIATAASRNPSSIEPVSPMMIEAGGRLKRRKPSTAPAAAASTGSNGSPAGEGEADGARRRRCR